MMKNVFFLLIISLSMSCAASMSAVNADKTDLTIAFGSCNDHKKENLLWKEIAKHQPKVWIWGGDNVYSNTKNRDTLTRDYQVVLDNKDYRAVQKMAKILGTWDDHDYGVNDGGVEFSAKKESQQAFLDFMGVSKTDKRRQQEGIYHAETVTTKRGKVKIISLDTRYFRSKLTKKSGTKKRYEPNKYGEGTMLGEAQWLWLQKELHTSTADFNIIMSSVQFLSGEHGFETWGNMPHEVDKLKALIRASKAKGVVLLSGDRHISEFSKTTLEGMAYPLIDFTSSGLTHAYTDYVFEANRYRIGDLVPKISYGLLLFDFEKKEITMQIRGINDVLLGELKQVY